MTKRELREIYLRKRKDLLPEEVNVRSQLIARNFFATFDLAGVRHLHTFLPIERHNEPDTWIIVERLQNEFPSINIVVPKVNASGTLDNFLLRRRDELIRNQWGIEEPLGEDTVAPNALDAVIVPMLIFDQAGHRIGYGKGFYDKLLSECRPDALRVGLSLFDGIEQIDDISKHDQPLHYCVTPADVIKF